MITEDPSSFPTDSGGRWPHPHTSIESYSLIPVTSLAPGAWTQDDTVSVGVESPGQGGATWLWVGSSPCQCGCFEGTVWELEDAEGKLLDWCGLGGL